MGCLKGEFKKMSIRDQENVNTVNTKIEKDKHLQIRVSQEIKDRILSYFFFLNNKHTIQNRLIIL